MNGDQRKRDGGSEAVRLAFSFPNYELKTGHFWSDEWGVVQSTPLARTAIGKSAYKFLNHENQFTGAHILSFTPAITGPQTHRRVFVLFGSNSYHSLPACKPQSCAA
jgi:hypothetical protein